jgi:hypothetical protein
MSSGEAKEKGGRLIWESLGILRFLLSSKEARVKR